MSARFQAGQIATNALGEIVRLIKREEGSWRHDAWDRGWVLSPDPINERELTLFPAPSIVGSSGLVGYHITNADNLASINENGLTPAIGPRSDDAGEPFPAVFLFRSFTDAEDGISNWLGDALEGEQAAIVKVTIPDGTPIVDPNFSAGYEYEIVGKIPPVAIVTLSDDIDNADWGAIRSNEIPTEAPCHDAKPEQRVSLSPTPFAF